MNCYEVRIWKGMALTGFAVTYFNICAKRLKKTVI
jgi:hypothetical protein